MCTFVNTKQKKDVNNTMCGVYRMTELKDIKHVCVFVTREKSGRIKLCGVEKRLTASIIISSVTDGSNRRSTHCKAVVLLFSAILTTFEDPSSFTRMRLPQCYNARSDHAHISETRMIDRTRTTDVFCGE